MSNSKGGNAPFSSLSSGPRSFQSKNLNNTLKPASLPPTVRDAKPSSASNLKGGMAVLVGKKQVTKSIGAAATPVPVNTPSFRSESKAKDPWGGTSTNASSATVGVSNATTTTPSSITATLAAASGSNKQETSSSAVTGPTSTMPVAPSRSSWAMRDESDSEEDDSKPAQKPTTGSSTDKNEYPERDWGRENYYEDEEDNYGRQRSRGNSDMHRYQNRFQRDGQDDRRYRDNNRDRDHYNARDRYDRPAFDKRNNAHQPLQMNSRARAMSEDFPSAAEDSRETKEQPSHRPLPDHHHSRNDSYHNNRDNRDREPEYRSSRYGSSGNNSNINRPYIQRDRASSGSFEHNNTSRHTANVNNPPGDRPERPTWQRVSTARTENDGRDSGPSKMNIAPTLLSKEQLKVNQVNTTLLRPKLEVGVGAVTSLTGTASSGGAAVAGRTISPPVMKVLSKQPVASSTGENVAEEPGHDDSKHSGAQDSLSKTFSSLLAAKERNDAAAAAAASGDHRKSHKGLVEEGDRDGDDYPEENFRRADMDDDRDRDRDDHRDYRHRDMDRPRRFRDRDDHERYDDRERDENDRYMRGGYHNRRDDYRQDDSHHYGKSYGQSRYHNDRASGPPAISGSYRSGGRNNYSSDNHHDAPYPPPTRPYPGSSSQITPTAILPPKRKGERVLYEPKSGQFVEDSGKDKEKAAKEESDDHFATSRTRKYSDSSSTHNAHGAHTNTTITAHHSTAAKEERTSSVVEEGGRWARVSVIKRGLEEQQNPNVAAINNLNSTINKQSDKIVGGAAATAKPEDILTKEQKKEMERLKYLEERKALREKERLTRKPRTKGRLYRFNDKGEIEELPAGERVFDKPVKPETEEEQKETKDEPQVPMEKPSEESAETDESQKESVVDEQSSPAPMESADVNPPPAVAHPSVAEEVAMAGNKSPTTPRPTSELVATASVFTPSQPLLASLQQQAQQQPGLIPNSAGIMSSPAPTTPSVPSGVPGPPMFLSSPGMSNMLFGNTNNANNTSMMNNAVGMDMFSHHLSPGATYGMNTMGMGNMTGMGMPGLGMTSNNNMYYGGMNMMPAGMMMDSGNLMGMVRNNNNNMNNVNGMYGGGMGGNAMGMGMGNLGWGSTPVTNAATPAVTASGVSGNTAAANVAATGNEDPTAANTAVVKDMFASPPTNAMNNNSMSWGYNANSGNTGNRFNANNGGNNLYGMMDMDGMNNNFYYGGGTGMGMGFFPGGNSMNHATTADAMMFGNMNNINGQQQMYGYGNMGYPQQQQPSSQTNNLANNSNNAMAMGQQGAAPGSDMFAANAGATTGGNNSKGTISATSSPLIGGMSAEGNQPSSLQSSNVNTGVANTSAMNSNMMSQNYNAMGGFNNNHSMTNNNNNNNMYGRGFRNNNPNNMSGGGMGSNMNTMYGNMHGNMNNNNNNNGMMYNAAPGGYTNMHQQPPQQQGGRNYGNNNNYYNNNSNYNNNYQQR